MPCATSAAFSMNKKEQERLVDALGYGIAKKNYGGGYVGHEAEVCLKIIRDAGFEIVSLTWKGRGEKPKRGRA